MSADEYREEGSAMKTEAEIRERLKEYKRVCDVYGTAKNWASDQYKQSERGSEDWMLAMRSIRILEWVLGE